MTIFLLFLAVCFVGAILFEKASLSSIRWLLFGLCMALSIGVFVFRLI